MPAEADHRKAFDNHLRAYTDTLNAHPDWGAVMLFYCAVHAVERLFARENLHHCEHVQRDYALKSKYSSLWHSYRVLKSESLKARYMDGGMFTLSANQVRKQLHDRHLQGIIRDVDARLEARSIMPTPPKN